MKRSQTTTTLRKTSGSHTSTRPASAAANHRTNTALPRNGSRSALAGNRPMSTTNDDDDDSSQSSVLPNKRKGTQQPLPPIVENPAPPLCQQRKGDNDSIFASVLSHVPSVGDNPNPCSSSSPLEKFRFSYRNISLSSAFRQMSLSSNNSDAPSASASSTKEEAPCPQTPSQIPKLKPIPKTPRPPEKGLHIFKTPRTNYTVHTESPGKIVYLNRNSNTPAAAWDTKGRLEDMETLYSQLKTQLESAATEKNGMEEGLATYKARCTFPQHAYDIH